MTNAIRGEAALLAGGKSYTLLLTLGALAEIEDALGDLRELGSRLKQARAGDLAQVAAALLKGGGHTLTPAEVLALPVDLGTLLAAIASAFERAGLKGGGEASGPFAAPLLGVSSSPSG
jgi:hypothetical protein